MVSAASAPAQERRIEKDTNHDGQADTSIFFDKNGAKIRVEKDSSFNGKVD